MSPVLGRVSHTCEQLRYQLPEPEVVLFNALGSCRDFKGKMSNSQWICLAFLTVALLSST